MQKVGVLGGLGPKATVYFMDMVIENTHATKDQDNIDMIVSNHATIPDRTDYILGRSKDNPLIYLVRDARILEKAGCDFLVMPCNTSHFMFDEIQKNINIPLLNMPFEVAKIINKNDNIHKVGIMATLGTIKGKIYNRYLDKEIYYADDFVNEKVMHLIYDKVKKGENVSKEEFQEVLNYYYENGCDVVITGCTELSVIIRDNMMLNDDRIIDSLQVLVNKTITKAQE